jgi:hypothetical protein
VNREANALFRREKGIADFGGKIRNNSFVSHVLAVVVSLREQNKRTGHL